MTIMSPFGTVPQRVDRAYHLGYEAGRQHWKRVALLAFAGGLIASARQRRGSPLLTLFVVYAIAAIFVVGLLVIPLVGLFYGVRGAVRYSRAHRPYHLSDGSVF